MVEYDREDDVPGMIYTAAMHEREMTRMETANRRWFIAFMVVLAMLFITNAGWIIYENQFQDVVLTQESVSDNGGVAQVFGTAIGDVNYNGEGETDDPGSD